MKTFLTKFVIDTVIINIHDEKNNGDYIIKLPTKIYSKLVKLIKEAENLEKKDN